MTHTYQGDVAIKLTTDSTRSNFPIIRANEIKRADVNRILSAIEEHMDSSTIKAIVNFDSFCDENNGCWYLTLTFQSNNAVRRAWMLLTAGPEFMNDVVP